MQLDNFQCECCDETLYQITVSTEQCAEVTRQSITIELDRDEMENLMEEIQRQLIKTPVRSHSK